MKNSNKNFMNVLSYIALLIVALLLAISNLLPLIGVSVVGPLVNALKTAQNVLILVIIGVLAYRFAFNQGVKWVKVLYWIAIAVFVVGTVLIWFIK